MSEQTEKAAYDATWLIPYLREIEAAGDAGFPVADTELWSTDEKPASKIRQSMYIGRLAKKAGDALVLTDAGRALING